MSHAPFPLRETAASWGISLSKAQCDQFAQYAAELQRWNDRVNLTAITDVDGIVVRHFLDSLYCACVWGNVPNTLVDVGSGAGFPGLPLKIAFPAIRLTLIESVGKKAAFLQHMVEVLDLPQVTILTARAEAVGHDPAHREIYDVATVRAVAALRVLVEYCLPLVRVGGHVLTPKGAHVANEVTAAQRALAILGGEMLVVEPVQLPALELRTMVVLHKIAPTPVAYPRAVGVPLRRPL